MLSVIHGLKVPPKSTALGWQPSRSNHSVRYWLGKFTAHGVVPSSLPSHKTFAPVGQLVMGITVSPGVSMVPQPAKRLQHRSRRAARSMSSN